MTIDSFIQIAALLVAIYALISRARQLELKLLFGFWEVLILWLYFISIIYLVFYNNFYKAGLAFEWVVDKIYVTPQELTFPITIFALLFFWIRFQKPTISRKSVSKFQELAEELTQQEEYSELISLLDRYWDSLVLIQSNNYVFPRLKNWVEKFLYDTGFERELQRQIKNLSDDELRALIGDIEKPKIKGVTSKKVKPKNSKKINATEQRKFFPNIFLSGIRKQAKAWMVNHVIHPPTRLFAKMIPDYHDSSEAARQIFRLIMTNDDFVNALSKNRPYLAIRFLETSDFPEKDYFFEMYLKCLMRNPKSILFFELSNNQETTQKRNYTIRQGNRLLSFLLEDTKKSEKMSVWKPIGDEVLSLLEKRAAFPDSDSYNFAKNPFEENEMKESPIFIGIQFFDIMVSRALYQGTEWHMWLYYFPHFVDKIVKNYKPHSSVDLSTEQTRYCDLIDQVIYAFQGWIQAAEDVIPSGQRNVLLQNTKSIHENGNIPKSSIIALGFCLESILEADNIAEKFKQNTMDTIFRLYFEVRNNPIMEGYGKVLLDTLKPKSEFGNKKFRSLVMKYFEQTDKIPYLLECKSLVDEFMEY
jgi:hypothetical protein